jgi:arabinogalactan oligomer/maltooligosaccharide transport system substrate-binding protein
MDNLIGRDLGRYHILEQLGEGGMATVYKAFDTRLETDVAVKVIRTDKFTPEVLARALKRFEREAKALARLTHPNIVKVIDFGEYEGSPYLVMPFLPGGNLKQYIRERGRLSWQDVARLLLPIAQALEFAHSQGVIHRDVKPANILLTQSGQPMLTDFGVAKVVEEEATVDLTGTAAAVGTPEYMAPEQTGKNIDHRVDIYALGIVFYEMLTGRRPYEADTPLAVLIKQASEPLPRPSQFVPGLPDKVEKMLLKALAKRPQDRYQTMNEFAMAIENLAVGKPGQAVVTSQKPRPSQETRDTVVQEELHSTLPDTSSRKTNDQTALPVSKTQSEKVIVTQAPPPKKQRGWIGWVVGIGIACLLLGGGAVIAILSSAKPTTSIVTIASPTSPVIATEPPVQPTIAPPTEAPTAVPVPVTITIWHQWSGAYLEAITKAFQEYSAKHPGVTIDLSKPDDVPASLAVAIPAGEGPDIIGWANDAIGTNALNGNIIALDDYGVTQDFLSSTYEPAAVKGVTWQGKIWALPESQEAITLVYNKAVASASDFPSNPMDFADLLAKAKAFKEAKGIPLFCNQGFPGADAFHVAPLYFGFGVPSYVDDQGKVYLNTPEAIAAGDWLTQIKPYLLPEMSHEICKTAIIEGKVAAWWTGPWAIADLEAGGVDYGFVPMGRPFVGVKTLMLTKNAVDRGYAEIALDIIKFYTSYEIQKSVTLANKTIPANAQVLQDPAVQALATIAGFGANANLGIPMANTPFAGAQWGPVGDATAAIWNGSQTPRSALAAAQRAIEAAIAGMK